MGLCFGRCRVGKNRTSRSSSQDDQHKALVDDNNPVEDINLIYRIIGRGQSRSGKFIERFWAHHRDMRYSRLNKTNNQPGEIPLQCLDAQLLLVNTNSINDHARTDMFNGVNPSPASSSLDLEWEHEYMNRNTSTHSWLALPEAAAIVNDSDSDDDDDDDDDEDDEDDSSELSIKNTSNHNNKISSISQSKLEKNRKNQRTSSRTASWSHISTPDSLEWDVNADDEQPFRSEEDLLDNETMELLQEIEWLKNRALNETGDSIRDATSIIGADESES